MPEPGPEIEVETAATGAAQEASAEGIAPQACVRLGLILTPSIPPDAAARLAADLEELLPERYPDVCWEISYTRDWLVTPPVSLTDLVDAARARLLEEHWDLVVHVTELPLRLSRRPLLIHTSPTHGVALVSLPAHGLLRIDRRLLESIADAVGVFAGDKPSERGRDGHRGRVRRRLVELGTDVDDPDLEGVAFLARVVTGNVRLILGMVRANHPWRLATRLSRALLGALGAGAYALVTTDVWRIATSMDAVRLAVLALATVVAAVGTLIAAHGLWERPTDRSVREQTALFNLVTVITVTFGILTLYLVVFLATLGAAALMIDSSLFTSQTGHHAGAWEYVRLAWLASSLATVGGALGGALESDAAVREAAYAYRPDED